MDDTQNQNPNPNQPGQTGMGGDAGATGNVPAPAQDEQVKTDDLPVTPFGGTPTTPVTGEEPATGTQPTGDVGQGPNITPMQGSTDNTTTPAGEAPVTSQAGEQGGGQPGDQT